MKNQQLENEEYVFTTNVTNGNSNDEFVVEFFRFSPEVENDNTPAKIVRNFDELIHFFEEIG